MMERLAVPLAELLSQSPSELSTRLRGAVAPTLVRSEMSVAPITVLLACSPCDSIWRFPAFSNTHLPGAWLDRLHSLLVVERGLHAELKGLRLPKRSFPLGLLEIDEEESFCHERYAWEPEWFAPLLLPNDLVENVEAYIERWVEQLADAAFTKIANAEWLSTQLRVSSVARAGAGRLLDLVSEVNLATDWSGPQGLAHALEDAVSRLETGADPEAVFGWSALAYIDDPIALDRTFLLRPRSRRWGDPAFMGEARAETVRFIDTILALKARAVRLMNRWQHFRAATLQLEALRVSLTRDPLSQGLRYDPVHELESYRTQQLSSFPVLAVSPFDDPRLA